MDGETVASETLRRWYAAWNAHDVQGIVSILTEDCRYEDPSTWKPVLEGRTEVEAYAAAAFEGIHDFHLEMLEEWVGPSGAVSTTYFRMTGTFAGELRAPGLPPLAPTGAALSLFGMDRNEIEPDGMMRRHQIFWDMAELGRQIGVFPPRGGAGEKLARRLQHLTALRRTRGR
jgi:ketosteroid isomerase-like protein